MHLEWWYWIVAGIVLILAELAVPAFYIIWFGFGALIVGVLLWMMPALSLVAQFGLWALASVAMVIVWFRFFSSDQQKTYAGTSDGMMIGEVGLLVSEVAPFERGRVRFQRPILGDDEWACIADVSIPAGERVKIISIEGSFLKVVKA